MRSSMLNMTKCTVIVAEDTNTRQCQNPYFVVKLQVRLFVNITTMTVNENGK